MVLPDRLRKLVVHLDQYVLDGDAVVLRSTDVDVPRQARVPETELVYWGSCSELAEVKGIGGPVEVDEGNVSDLGLLPNVVTNWVVLSIIV
jgi:hypothetical protein